jgi:SulP family sulfate permease
MILLTLLFLTPLFYYLPQAALAAVIVTAVYRLLDFEEARRIFRIRRVDGLALLITFALTLLVGVEQGIIIGAFFALLAFIRRTAYPNITELGYVEEEEAYLDLRRFPEARTYPEALIVRFEADLYFANISFLEEWLIEKTAERPELKWIVINCRGINSIDETAIMGLEDLISNYRSRGIEILFAGMKLPVSDRVQRAGWDEKLGENMSYRTTRDAIRAIGLPAECEPHGSEPH